MKLVVSLVVILGVLVGCSRKEEGKSVRVLRGAYNQPSIKVERAPEGEADYWLFETQGYVEAQDRFVQMDMLRRVSRGRLAEVFGASAESKDIDVLAIGLPYAAIKSYEKLKSSRPDVYTVLEAFAVGVNRYIKEQVDKNSDLIQTYRRWTRNSSYVPDAWEVVDSLAIAESIAYYLSGNLSERITIGKVYGALLMAGNLEPGAEISKLLDLRPTENAFILPSAKNEERTVTHLLPEGDRNVAIENLEFLKGFAGLGGCKERGYPFSPCVKQSVLGSNNWVVSRAFAGGKQAFVANDPHLTLSYPNNFIEVALNSKDAGGNFQVRGVNLPGLPGILIGHNLSIAWALTNQPADVDDVHVDFIHKTEDQVVFKGKYVPLTRIAHPFKVRSSDGQLMERSLVLRASLPQHGFIVSDHLSQLKPAMGALEEALKDILKGNRVAISYKWTGHQGNTNFGAVMDLNRAQNFEQFKKALNQFEVGAQNVVYADTVGNIGYYSHAHYPIRKYLSKQVPPNTPLDGTRGQQEWEEEWRDSVPELYNPPAGRIVTANNDPFGTSAVPYLNNYKDYFSASFDFGCRAKRITERLDEAKGKVTLETIQSIQTDVKDLFALRAVGLLKKVKGSLRLSPRANGLLESLLTYDGYAHRNRREPLLADTWIKQLARSYFSGIVSEIAGAGPDADDLLEELAISLMGAKTVYNKMWTGLNQESGPEADSLRMLEVSLDKAAAKLEVLQGNWGQANRLNFFFPLVDVFPKLVTAPIERDGSFATVNVSGSIFGPNFRLIMVLEEGKPIDGVNVIAGGNYSASEGSQWLDELFKWRDGKYRPLVSF